VRSIEQLASGAWRLITPTEEVIAEHVVIAAGFWANEVGKMIGLDLPITPMLHQYLVTEDHPDIVACAADSIPLVRHHDYQWYTRRERGGMVLGAYESDPQTWSIDGVPAEFGMELMQPELDRVAHLMADAMERIPALAEAGIKTNVHGPVSYSADGQPLIGPAPGLRNAWLACGSGFGIGEGAGAGKLLAEWMVEGQPPMHMGAFDPRRFGPYADRSYRVEKAVEVFALQFATHYPLEEREAARQKKITPIYGQLKQAGAHFGVAFGWERANWFAQNNEEQTLSYKRTEWFNAVARECAEVTTNAGIIDLSGFSKFWVSGSNAATFLNALSANRIPTKRGDIRLCHFLNKNGRLECEFTVTCVGDQQYYLNCAATAELHHLDWLQTHLIDDPDVQIENLTSTWGVLGIAGPNTRKLLQPHCAAALSNENFPWLSARPVEIQGIEVLAMRVSYVGELGWELHHPIAAQPTLYDTLKSGIEGNAPADFGFYALNAMRMEKAYKAWGVELTIENTAWELGLEKFIDMDNRDFVGRQALIEQRQVGWKSELYYVELEAGDSDAIGGEAVLAGDKLVGVMVSGAYGHRTGKSLGFAMLSRDVISSDVSLEAELIGVRRKIQILHQPAFDPRSESVKR
jgi:dimethylglycine dehydrogenase